MKLTKKLLPVAGAAAMIATSMVTPTVAQADVSASMAFSNMYLWRGQNVGNSGGAISGSLDYSNESGLYAGIWTSSEKDGHETDLYIGYSTEVSGVGVDVSYWNYLYPEDGGTGPDTGLGDTNAAEIVLALSYMDFSFGYYMQVDGDKPDDNYITLSYSFGKYSLTYGLWDLEDGTVDSTGTTPATKGQDEYSHLTLSYAATDDLSFAVSKAFSDLDDSDLGGANVEEDFLFQVTYSKDFDLK